MTDTRDEDVVDVDDVLSTLTEWHNTLRQWSGSAFIAGEDVGDTDGAFDQLYRDLCRIGNQTVWMEEQITRLRSQRVVPEGWRLVPSEPTDVMIHAGRCETAKINDDDDYAQAKACWSAMLAASPPSPTDTLSSAVEEGHTAAGDALRSLPDFHSDRVEQLAFEIARTVADLAIEECAQIAETRHEDDDGIDLQVKRRIAAAIRSLAHGGDDVG